MAQQYNNYFTSLFKAGQEQANGMPSLGQTPPLDNYLSSESVLGSPDAQNSAQRAESQADTLKKTYDLLTSYQNSPLGKKLIAEQEASTPKETKYPANKTIFAGSYYQTDDKGQLKTEMYDIAKKMSSGELLGFAPMGVVKKKDGTPNKMTSGSQKSYKSSVFEDQLAEIRGTKAGVASSGTADDRARWEAQAYRAKAEADAQAAKDAQMGKK